MAKENLFNHCEPNHLRRGSSAYLAAIHCSYWGWTICSVIPSHESNWQNTSLYPREILRVALYKPLSPLHSSAFVETWTSPLLIYYEYIFGLELWTKSSYVWKRSSKYVQHPGQLSTLHWTNYCQEYSLPERLIDSIERAKFWKLSEELLRVQADEDNSELKIDGISKQSLHESRWAPSFSIHTWTDGGSMGNLSTFCFSSGLDCVIGAGQQI